MSDPVVHPSHYTSHPSGVECIQVTRHHNFCIGSAIKYLWRQGLKDGNPAVQDLRKAMQYIQFEIDRIEGFPKHAAPVCDCDLDAGRICAKCTSAEPESWATWQEVPDGVHYYSQPTGAGPWVNRLGVRVVPEDGSVSCYSPNSMAEFAPFVRKLS